MERRKRRKRFTWLAIMMKAFPQAIHHFTFPPILKQGLPGDSDFRVLDVLLQQGTTDAVNALGEGGPQPRICLADVAVDRLLAAEGVR